MSCEPAAFLGSSWGSQHQRPDAGFRSTLRRIALIPWACVDTVRALRSARTLGDLDGEFRTIGPDTPRDMMDSLPPHMRPERSFQGFILALQRFWAEQGCVILQPYDMEMGAGTFHPATTLRALGPKPWKAAYVQPSRRPSDGRRLGWT